MSEELRGIAYLRSKLALKKSRVITRYRFYDMKYQVRDFGISTPPELMYLNSVLGWCAKAVDALSDRLVFMTFRNDTFDMNGIFNQNNPDVLFDSAVLSAMISSCSFLYISADEDGFPRVQVIDGGHATGVIDPITNLLKEGYAVLETDDYDNPIVEAYFSPTETVIYENGGESYSVPNPTGYPLLVPVIYRPDAVRPFGHSRISRACMSIINSAIRTIKRSEIAAEFYSYPQKYITGLSQDAEIADKWKASMSAMITFSKDENGDTPSLGQFSQQSMAPHTEQLRMFASLFAGETGLTLDDLGFATDNPSSAEAIKAAHENLRLTAAKAQRTFGSGFLNAGFLAACLRDEYPYKRAVVYQTKPIWEPTFAPDASTLSVIGDGAIKINQAVPEYFTAENLRDLTGIEGSYD